MLGRELERKLEPKRVYLPQPLIPINLFPFTGEDLIPDVEDDPGDKEDREMIHEQMFTFEKYEEVSTISFIAIPKTDPNRIRNLPTKT